MKKILSIFIIIMSSTTFATFPVCSESAPKNVDKVEYHEIFCEIYTQGILNLSDYQLALLFTRLRTIGTPAALQHIYDIEQLIHAFWGRIKSTQTETELELIRANQNYMFEKK